MPRVKKKDPPKADSVTAKSKTDVKKALKSSGKPKRDLVKSDDSYVAGISEVSLQAASGRSQRTAKSKPKSWESLIPKSRDTSLVNISIKSPTPVKTSQTTLVNNTSVKPTEKPSRSRSTTKKSSKSEVPEKTPVEPICTKTVRQSRTVSSKRGETVQQSLGSVEPTRQSSRARNPKQDCTVEKAVKVASERNSRAASIKGKTVTTAATVPRQSSRARTKEKTVSSSPAKGKTNSRDKSSKDVEIQSSRAIAKVVSQADTVQEVPASKFVSKAINADKAKTVRQSSRSRGATTKDDDSNKATSEKKVSDINSADTQTPPVKRTTKRGGKAKDSQVEEVAVTKFSKASKTKKKDVSKNAKIDSFFKKTPIKGSIGKDQSILKDLSEPAYQSKWKSFSSQNLSFKNKRLSKEVDASDDMNKSASKKRKNSLSDEEIDPTPTKKPAVRAPVRKVGFQSIAKSFAKNGEIIQKNAPRKTLCSLDILGLLDDGVGEVQVENREAPIEEEDPVDVIPIETETQVLNSQNVSLTKIKEKVPVWKKQVDVSKVASSAKSFDDVFNPENYGEEEFGPEDVNPKKKRVRKKKKDTKAILVFGKSNAGKKETNEVKKAVKESHNLKTPEVTKKSRKAAIETGKKLIQPIPNIFDNPPTSSKDPQPAKPQIITKVTYSSDFSHGAHNYFDSEIHQYDPAGDDFDHNDDNFNAPEPSEELNRSGAFGEFLNIPNKNYKTPAVPKKISRLQTENSSTPNQKEAPKPVPVTIKEQIKCAFGFDDSEEDTDASSENESMSISPVKKVTNPVLAMFENDSILAEPGSSRLSTITGITGGSSRISTMTGFGRLSSIQGSTFGSNISRGAQIPIINKPIQPRKDGPYRVNLPPPRMKTENKLLAQVRALKMKEQQKKMAASKKKPSRFSPRKPMHSSTMNGDPIHSSTLLDFDRLEVPKPKNAYEMMKEASRDPNKEKFKKLVKKVPKHPEPLEQSSLYDDPPEVSENLARFSDNKNKSDTEKLSDKENADANSPQKILKPAVSRVYKRKSGNNSTLSKPSVSFDQSLPTQKTPKKESKKEKQVKQWAQLQTSHFSEVEEFDLSFS